MDSSRESKKWAQEIFPLLPDQIPFALKNKLTYVQKLIRYNDIYFKFNNQIQKEIQSALKDKSYTIHIRNVQHEYFGVQCQAHFTIWQKYGTGLIAIKKRTYIDRHKVVSFQCSKISTKRNIMIDNYQELFVKHYTPNSVSLVHGYCRHYSIDNNKSYIPEYLVDIIIHYFQISFDDLSELINIFLR